MKIYLAVPFSGMEEFSFKAVNKKAGELMSKGHIVFSPISHTHPIACECDLPKDWEFWRRFDIAFIEWCDALYVYCLPGWKKSIGVKSEIRIAINMGKEIIYSEEE